MRQKEKAIEQVAGFLQEEVAAAVRDFARAIAHGDAQHRQWLREAAERFVDGLPLPNPPEPQVSPDDVLAHLRKAGWSVVAHYDYQLEGNWRTFWILGHQNGRYIKANGKTDAEALVGAAANAWRGLLPRDGKAST